MEKYDFKKLEPKWPHSAKASRGGQAYNFKAIESKWQKRWEDSKNNHAADFSKKPKHYNLVEFPYPSGAGLHVGHCMGYGASDAFSRMKRMQGYNVMYPMGWDAFGLPTENYAIKTDKKPQEVTAENIAIFKEQMKRLAYSFDWDREINTTDPKYYKWTQWIFLQFYKHAVIDEKLIEVADDDTTTPRLAYQAEMPINWCPSCKIGLANEEVVAGKCERCGAEAERKMQKQWMLRITEYADRLIDDLKTVDYLPQIARQQINWIGRSEGAEIDFRIKNTEYSLKVFTTRADTLFGATFMVVAPEHEIIRKLEARIRNIEEVKSYINKSNKKSDLERTELAKEKTGVEIKGVKAINPINGAEIPIFVADYVLSSYGTGAIMAVPAHDERDYEFAKKHNLEIVEVISGGDVKKEAFTNINNGVLINSGQFNGKNCKDAGDAIIKKLEKDHAGKSAVNYKLRDWIFSRQHYWGEPIPIIHCHECWKKSKIKNKKSKLLNDTINDHTIPIPVSEKDLPVILPEVDNYQPTDTGESPLSEMSEWVNVKCTKCGAEAKRETDTMPNWAGSSWYYAAYAASQKLKVESRKGKESLFNLSKKEIDYWLPVDLYNGGMEHTTLHLLYSRFWHKFLYDLGCFSTSEPYSKRIAHGIILGADNRKMSKSFGNVINPDSIIDKYGADTLRAYIMFIGPYDQESAWNMNGVLGVHRFIVKLWANTCKAKDNIDDGLKRALNKTIKGVSEDIENYSMNTYIAKLMEYNNLMTRKKSINKNMMKDYAKLLSPAMPYLASEIWEILGEKGSIFDSEWPKYNENLIQDEEIEIVIQVNGKVRDRLIVKSGISDEELRVLTMKSEIVTKWLKGSKPKKVIVVSGKLVSIVV
jgi:leucyl-tRNA synthetase